MQVRSHWSLHPEGFVLSSVNFAEAASRCSAFDTVRFGDDLRAHKKNAWHAYAPCGQRHSQGLFNTKPRYPLRQECVVVSMAVSEQCLPSWAELLQLIPDSA